MGYRPDVVVVGSGIAGLYAALAAGRAGARVAMVSTPAGSSSSHRAQGGIAAALDPEDSPHEHLQDTLRAGRGLVRASAARVLCEESPGCVRDLEDLGVAFDVDSDGRRALGLEGGHSTRRVANVAGSATGRHVLECLERRVAAEDAVRRVVGMVCALRVDDGRCGGVVVEGTNGERVTISAAAVILATGGAAGMWARTTNHAGSIGSGVILAHAAGATVADLEFVQFHPTALVHHRYGGALISEAVRGEGAVLINSEGQRFVDELAPRDDVAVAVEKQLNGGDHRAVYLDMRRIDTTRFDGLMAALARAGLDARCQPIPVAPAAHYTVGGVRTDLHGATDVPGLYAAGECACTGVHGANRLASNSLAECLVFGRRAALAALDEPAPSPTTNGLPADVRSRPLSRVTRTALWSHAGLFRSAEGLGQLAGDADPLARLIALACLTRAESRGSHRRLDAPGTEATFDQLHTVIPAAGTPRLEKWK